MTDEFWTGFMACFLVVLTTAWGTAVAMLVFWNRPEKPGPPPPSPTVPDFPPPEWRDALARR